MNEGRICSQEMDQTPTRPGSSAPASADLIERLNHGADILWDGPFAMPASATLMREAADVLRRVSNLISNFEDQADTTIPIRAIRRALNPVLDEGRCVAAHMGGSRCVDRCMCPRDCSERPLAASAITKS
jgi:hypothetical protein